MFNIILLGITSLLTDISSEMVYPLLPIFLITTLGSSPAVLGLIEGIAESIASLLKVFSGYFSDRIKARRPLVIFGYASSAIGKLFLYLSTGWTCVLIARTMDRFGKGVRTAPRDALIAENSMTGQRGRAFGLHRAMDTLGATVGVCIAYFLITGFKGALRSVFLFSLIPASLGVLFLFLVKEKKALPQTLSKKPEFKWGLLDKKLKHFLVFAFIFALGNSSNQFLLLRAKDLGSSVPQVILFYLVYNIVYALVAFPASKLSDKVGRKKILILGYLFYGLVYLGFALNQNPVMFWFLFASYGLYAGFTEGVEKALITDISSAQLRATTMGLHAAIVGAGLLPASLFAGLLWKFFGPAATFYFGGFMGFFASIGLWFVLRGI